MKVIYFVIREPRNSKAGEPKALAQFDDGAEARNYMEKEASQSRNRSYRIYLHAESEAQARRPQATRFLLF